MRSTRNPTAAVLALVALVVAAGCSGSGSSATTTTSSTVGLDIKKVVLLTPADVPGSEIAVSAEQDFDFSTCFPGNRFATRTDQSELKYPGLQLTDGTVVRQYGSRHRRGTPEQAKAFVTGVASPAGSACMVDAFKRAVDAKPTTPKFDAAALTGGGASVAVADGGGLLSISGQLKVGEGAIFTEADLLVFSKGGAVVYVSASGLGGPKVPGQAAELAQKIAYRHP